jgi:tRNA-dihydrouridine synthase C
MNALGDPLQIVGRSRSLTLPGRLLLAPMEGITDPLFRDCVLPLGGWAAGVTEFVRISVHPVPVRVFRRFFGSGSRHRPVAIQLMAAAPTHVAASVQAAEDAGAAWIDLNFGCPAPTVFGHCAGSALLAHPARMAAIAAEAVAATVLPVSAKIRVGIQDPKPLADNLRALADAGVAMITVHGRLRTQGYHQPATWAWIGEAVAALRAAGHRIPLAGNGSVEAPAEAEALCRATGCDLVMIGRGALADPWIAARSLGAPPASAAQAVAFAADYHARAAAARGPGVALSKLKQLVRWYTAGDLFVGDETGRNGLLRLTDAGAILHQLGERRRDAMPRRPPGIDGPQDGAP